MMRKTGWSELGLTFALLFCFVARVFSGSLERDLRHLERSFSVHASLATLPLNAAWQTNFPAAATPLEGEIRNAGRLLVEDYGANRLYLFYHKEISLLDAERVFQIWREACPVEVEVVPAIQLQTEGVKPSEIFSLAELRRLSDFLKKGINRSHVAVFYTDGAREEGALKLLNSDFPNGLIRLGVDDGEKLTRPFSSVVVETSSALCRGRSNDEWQQSGGGLEQLLKLVSARSEQPVQVAWDFIALSPQSSKTALDQSSFGDPERNLPLPSGRSTLAAAEILRHANADSFLGFSSDLRTVQISSQAISHDGSGYSFYEMLKRGQIYVGYYARPFHEIGKIYRTLRSGNAPEAAATASH